MPKQPRRVGSTGPFGSDNSAHLRLAQAESLFRGVEPEVHPVLEPGVRHTTAPGPASGHRGTAAEVFASFDTVSRKMEDLARDLDCFGFFDDGDDEPRAA